MKLRLRTSRGGALTTASAPLPTPLALLMLIGALALLPAGCATATDLEPSPAGNIIAKNTQRASEAGVVLTAEVDRWDDHPAVLREVTPVWVSIDNRSGVPVELRYRHFRMATPAGVELAALPPYNIRGEVTTRVDNPGFVYDGFAVYRPVGGIYPAMPVTYYPRYTPAYYDGFYDYNGLYDDYWTNVSLPTPRMVALALPEGVIEPGGSITGYLYFPEIDDDDDLIEPYKVAGKATIQLEAELVNAETGESLGMIEMPFLVD